MTYFDRYNSTWKKILFRPDKKSQSAEFNEIQSLINYQHTQAFEYLFSVYRIIKGLKLTVNSFTSTGYVIKVGAGQVFIRKNDRGYFIDIPETTVLCSYNERIYIGVNPKFTTVTNFKDSLTGGELFGDLGADRLTVKGEVVVNEDSFPIGVVQSSSINEYPVIFYYKDKSYSTQYTDSYVTNLITDYVALRQYEESGDFISEGLELSVTTSNSVTVAVGKAYIKGNLVELYYPYSTKITKETEATYSVYLTYYGGIIVEKKAARTIPNSIFLGLVCRNNNKLYTISSKARSVTNSDLKLLQKKYQSNFDSLLDNLLAKQSVNKYIGSNLSGLLIDSFINLSNSDINSTDYNTSINPKYGTLSAGFLSNNINFSNLEEVSNSGVESLNRDNLPYYLTPITSEKIVIDQSRATSFISLNSGTISSIIVNPPKGQPNTTTKEYKSINELDLANSYNLQVRQTNNITFTSTLETTLVTLTGMGFSQNADNLKVVFGNIQISEFTILKGSQGANINTIKANEDGSFIVSFNVPANLLNKQYTITVSNSTINANTLFNGGAITYLDSKVELAQTFTIETPLIVSKINLAIRKVPNFTSNNIDLLAVNIVKANNSKPTNEIVGQGILTLADVNTSSDGTVFSSVQFTKPVYLDLGQYAFTISLLTSGQPLELYYAEVGQQSLSSISVSDIQPLIGGELLYKIPVLCGTGSEWYTELSKDLTFQLVQLVPSTTKAEIAYELSNPLGNIHYINRLITASIYPGTKLEYFYKDTKGQWLDLKQSQSIEGNRNNIEVKLVLSGTSNIFPIVMLNQSCFTIYENQKTGTWISKTIEYLKGYKNVEVEFDYYKPTGTEISVAFSSNAGETWQTIQLEGNTVELINGNIPLSKGTWIVKNLDPTTVSTDINGNTSRILRTKLTLKIEFSSKSPEVVPYIMKLKGVVY